MLFAKAMHHHALTPTCLYHCGQFPWSCRRYWEELSFSNNAASTQRVAENETTRFAKNWIEIQAWEEEEFDAIIMMNADQEASLPVSQQYCLCPAQAIVSSLPPCNDRA